MTTPAEFVEPRSVQARVPKMPRAGWADDELRERFLNVLAKFIEFMLPEGMLFSLVLFEQEPGGEAAYVSNAERQSAVDALNEFVDRYNQADSGSKPTETEERRL